ncbi:MAG: F0F1 ATP synthase subunit epsilon [Fuerstiella sp.]|nr:F0F1 ATP synthase subunit epsilon [Fuerstiella sp.]MCP4855866.1 F0F1 ATP synthase subunit epsilon [Fuerstiella sp.]
MRLKVLLPTEVLVDRMVSKVVAEAENGSFCLLPRHIDFVAALAPGILTFTDNDDCERYAGLAAGILVKNGSDVFVSVEHGVEGENLGELRDIVSQHFEMVDERERQAVSAVAHLEASFVRRFLALEEQPHV